MLEMYQLAEIRSVYPEKEGIDYREFLKGISKETLYKVATYLIGKNLFLNTPLQTEEILANWFSAGNKEFAEDIASRIDKYLKTKGIELTIVSVIGALKILQFGLDLEEAGLLNEKSKEESERDLFFAMLAINQEEDTNHTSAGAAIAELFPDADMQVPALLTHMNFATQDITDFNLQEYTTAQTIRALFLFQFLETSDIGRKLLARFYKHYGLRDWREYFLKLFPVIFSWIYRKTASAVDIELTQDDQTQANIDFLKKLAITDYKSITDLDYIKLREQPLIQISELVFRVIHPLFIVDKIYKGLFFLLHKLSNEEPKMMDEFRSWYTTEFSEGVVFSEVLKYAVPNYDSRFFDEELSALGVGGPPDGYLRLGSDVFLFENKDIFIGAPIKSAYDFKTLIKEIKKKLLLKGTTAVGIGQIITNLKKLLSKENHYDDGLVVEEATFYPILVLHDQMFDSPGLNKILDKLFQDELLKIEAEGLDISRVKKLVLVNIDTLIHLAPLLKNGAITMKELLDNFYTFQDVPNPFPGSKEQLYAAMKDTNLSFSHFVHKYMRTKFGANWRSRELFNELMSKAGLD